MRKPTGQKQNSLFAPRTDRLIPCAAGLRPRGDESDQSDQSAEITVIPEVRGRAQGPWRVHTSSRQICAGMANIWPPVTRAMHAPVFFFLFQFLFIFVKDLDGFSKTVQRSGYTQASDSGDSPLF